MKKKIFIIAGENSGDKIGALVINQLKEQSSDKIEFKCVGGEMMKKAGVTSIFPISEISLMGFFEILPHIFKLKRLINYTIQTIKDFNPDVVITIDSPGFCYRVASSLRDTKSRCSWMSYLRKQVSNLKRSFKKNVDEIPACAGMTNKDGLPRVASHSRNDELSTKLVHIVAPSVWAYKPQRAAKFAKVYDLLLTLLPFEPPYFEKEGLKAVFAGHFAFEQKLCDDPNIFRKKYKIKDDEKLLCVTPGSRKGEVKRHMPIFLDTIKLLQKDHKLKAVFLAASPEIKDLIENYTRGDKTIIVTLGDKFESYKAADVALAKSGTNSLEISLHGTLQIVAYKVNWLSWWYIKSVALIKYATLVNIIAGREIIPEFLQGNCKAELLASEISKLLKNKGDRQKQIDDTAKILDSMKNKEGLASKISATEILKLI